MTSQLRAIFFDLGGTLFSNRDIPGVNAPALVEAGRRLGLDQPLVRHGYQAHQTAWIAAGIAGGDEAQLARLEAARLYAATGQMTHVHRLLDGLDRNLISDVDVADIEREMAVLFDQHEDDVIRMSQARDYQMLYHHYMRIGKVEQAWKFRIKSSETRANGSDRAMFQRQADVIAVLYNSNFAMDRAKRYLDKAGSIYNDSGVSEMIEQTREMESLIY